MTEDNTPLSDQPGRDGADRSHGGSADGPDSIQALAEGKLTTPEQRMAALAARGPYLVLWTAATLRTFTVARPDRMVIWHSRFHADVVIDSTDVAAKAGALQAIWLAARARDEWGADVATLRLTVAHSGVDRTAVEVAAISSGLILDLVVDATANPALDHQIARWIDWWTSDLGTLIHNPQGLL
ncbi:hypothetical protein [Nocardia sp. NBC_01388]|uniref:hypothetical protein n=1 Tax=Nocardia sp. NBC_01388 TaxID=2903596 RepID=UPI0032523088